MSWVYDYMSGDIVWSQKTTELVFDGLIDFGSEVEGDIELSMGLRENEGSVIDSGSRVINSET
jgi:hypothetical protein